MTSVLRSTTILKLVGSHNQYYGCNVQCFAETVGVTFREVAKTVSMIFYCQGSKQYKVFLTIKACQSGTVDMVVQFALLTPNYVDESFCDAEEFNKYTEMCDERPCLTLEITVEPLDGVLLQSSAAPTMHKMSAMFLDKEMADFTIKVKKSKFPVHKLILSCHSPILKTMIQSGMQESATDELIISDFSVAAVKSFVHLMYEINTDLQHATMDSKLEILHLADKYQASVILDVISDAVHRSLTHENCLLVLVEADKLSCEPLKKQVLQYIKFHIKAVVTLHKDTLAEQLGSLIAPVFTFIVL